MAYESLGILDIRLRDAAAIAPQELACEPLQPPPPMRPVSESPHPDADFVVALQQIYENRGKCVLWNPKAAERVRRGITPKPGLSDVNLAERVIIPHLKTAERKDNIKRANGWIRQGHKPALDHAAKIRALLGIEDNNTFFTPKAAVQRKRRTLRFQSKVLNKLDRNEIKFESWLYEQDLDRDAAERAARQADRPSRPSLPRLGIGMGLQRLQTQTSTDSPRKQTVLGKLLGRQEG